MILFVIDQNYKNQVTRTK